MVPLFARTAVRGLNHLLAGEHWARERLRPFAGRSLRVAAGTLSLDLTVDGEGLFHPAEASGAEPTVVIELPADAPVRFLTDRDSILAAAKLSGPADFTETLGFVFRNLRWDVEEDLAKVVGDIAAHRLVQGGKAFFGWQKKAATNLAANAAEYFGEESHLLVPRRDMDRFQAALRTVEDELARLEKRLAGL